MPIKLFAQQRESIRDSNARINIWEGSVRSGKTIASLYRWIHYSLRGPRRGDYAMIGKTERTLKHNIIDPLTAILGKSLHYNQGKGELYIGRKRMYIFGANDNRAEEKIRGGTWGGCYGDEITLWPESVFAMALSRMSIDGAKFFGTTNTDSPFHWLRTQYLDRAKELDLKSFHFQLEYNMRPAGFLDPKFVMNLRNEYTGLWYERFILGRWVLAEGTIYDMWSDKYVQSFPAKFDRYVVGIDYGTANPTTWGLYGFNSPINCVYLIDEYYYDSTRHHKQLTDGEYAREFERWMNRWGVRAPRLVGIYIDPSAVSFRMLLRQQGWRVLEANNRVLDGIRFVGNLLSDGQFVIHSRCKNTIREFSSYVWDANAANRGEDKPLKQHDHCMDRNRYALYSFLGPAGSRVGRWGEPSTGAEEER